MDSAFPDTWLHFLFPHLCVAGARVAGIPFSSSDELLLNFTEGRLISSEALVWESKSGKAKRPDLEWEGNRRKGEAYSGRKCAVVLCLGHL